MHNVGCFCMTLQFHLFSSFFLSFFFKIYRHVMDLCVIMFILLWISCITVKPLCCQIYNKHCQSPLDNLQVLTLNNKIESIPPQTTGLKNYQNWINTSNKISFMLNSVYPFICPSPFKCLYQNADQTISWQLSLLSVMAERYTPIMIAYVWACITCAGRWCDRRPSSAHCSTCLKSILYLCLYASYVINIIVCKCNSNIACNNNKCNNF